MLRPPLKRVRAIRLTIRLFCEPIRGLNRLNRVLGDFSVALRTSPQWREQRGQRALIRRGGAGGFGEEAVVELAFLGLELVNALLDGALADELVEEDRLAETQTLAAILNLTIFLIKLCIIS